MKFENVIGITIIGCSVGMFGGGGLLFSMIREYGTLNPINILFVIIACCGLVIVFLNWTKLDKLIKNNKEFLEKQV